MPFAVAGLSLGAANAVCMSTLSLCANCQKSGAEKRCTKCKCSHYCSRECRREDWSSHKKACPQLKMMMDGWSPSSTTRKMVESTKKEKSDALPDEDLPGAALYSQGMDLISGTVGYLEVYPDQSKMGHDTFDIEKGVDLIMEAAEMGHKGAQYATALNYLPDGFLYDTCSGPEEASSVGNKWIKLAAENGHAEACMTYGNKIWRQGGVDGKHPIDNSKALFWIRRALSCGVSETGMPDPQGHGLSKKSFNGALLAANCVAREMFLYEYSPLLHDEEVEGWEEQVWLSADCGIGAAMQHAVEFTKEESES